MSSVNESIRMAFSKVEEYISTKTVVGEAVHIGDVILIPLVDVMVGMATGLSAKASESDIGGGGMGAKMTPSAVVVIVNGTVQLVNVKSQESMGKLIDMVPGILSKLGLDSVFSKKEHDEPAQEDGE